jgi:hypothetical protein
LREVFVVHGLEVGVYVIGIHCAVAFFKLTLRECA